jgi:hypothetical protein
MTYLIGALIGAAVVGIIALALFAAWASQLFRY